MVFSRMVKTGVIRPMANEQVQQVNGKVIPVTLMPMTHAPEIGAENPYIPQKLVP